MKKTFKIDTSYNKFNGWEHVYCPKCQHSMYFMKNHSATCGICGTLVYPSKKSEFKEKMERLIRKNNYGSNE